MRRLAITAVLSLLLSSGPVLAEATKETLLRIQRLERALDNKGLLDLVRQVELLQAEVRQLRGELENQIFALEQQRKSQRSAYLDVDRRVGALEQAGPSAAPTVADAVNGLVPLPGQVAVDPPLPTLPTTAFDNSIAGQPAEQSIGLATVNPEPSATVVEPEGLAPITTAQAPTAPADVAVAAVVTAPPVVAPVAGPTIDSGASEAAYREAFALLKAGQYDESIAAFDLYLQRYPASQYADNAQYWLGEAYYVKREFAPAIEQYQALLKNYPASKKQSHALLKIAYSYDELGQADEARKVIGTLKSAFPGTAAARLADERLQRLNAAAP